VPPAERSSSASPCEQLTGTLEDLADWAMALPVDAFHGALCQAVVHLVRDALHECEGAA
jgi:hypothetical protein